MFTDYLKAVHGAGASRLVVLSVMSKVSSSSPSSSFRKILYFEAHSTGVKATSILPVIEFSSAVRSAGGVAAGDLVVKLCTSASVSTSLEVAKIFIV